MRDALYERLARAFEMSGLRFDAGYWEDRGDGAVIVLPPDVKTALLVSSVADRLHAELRDHNALSSVPAQIRLRLAVHAGEVASDGHGIVGTAVNHVFRILDAPPFKELFGGSGSCLGVIVSDRVYEDVIRHGVELIHPGDYQRVEVAVKETSTVGWVRIPATAASSQEVAARDNRAVAAPGHPPEAVVAGRVRPSVIFPLVDALLEVPVMRSAQGRQEVVEGLRLEISAMIRRHAEARMEAISILRTCLEYPGGLRELLETLHFLAGDSMALRRFEQALAQVLPLDGI